MAARLHRAKATLEVSSPEAQRLESVSVSVRNSTATVRLGTEVILERGDVARVVPRQRGSWTLMFDGAADGDVWTVTDEKRRCCGRS